MSIYGNCYDAFDILKTEDYEPFLLEEYYLEEILCKSFERNLNLINSFQMKILSIHFRQIVNIMGLNNYQCNADPFLLKAIIGNGSGIFQRYYNRKQNVNNTVDLIVSWRICF